MEEGGEGLRPAEESLSLIAVDPKEWKIIKDSDEGGAYTHYLPIKDVEEAIGAKAGNIVAGEVLDDVHLMEHDDLGDEGDRLQP